MGVGGAVLGRGGRWGVCGRWEVGVVWRLGVGGLGVGAGTGVVVRGRVLGDVGGAGFGV